MHDVALVRISNAGLKCAARRSMKIQDAKIMHKIAICHHRTTLSGYIFATKAYIDNVKNLLNSNFSSTCPRNMVNFGQLAVEISLRLWAQQFQRVSRLGFVVAPMSLNGGQPNFARCLAVF